MTTWQSQHWGAAMGGLTFQRVAPGFFPDFVADPQEVARHEAEVARLATILDDHLKDRTWVLDELSVVDLALASYTSKGVIDLSGYRNLSRWLERIPA